MRNNHKPMTARERELVRRCVVLMAGVIFFSLMAAVAARSMDYYPPAPRTEYDPWGINVAQGMNGYISPDSYETSYRLKRVLKGDQPLYFKKKASRKYDSVTIVVSEITESELTSSNDLKRDSSNTMNINSLLFPSRKGVRQTGVAAGNDAKTLSYSNSRAHKSDSTIERAQAFATTITGEVLEVQRNGYLIVQARKRFNVNGEEQEVTLTGIVNPDYMDSNSAVRAEHLIDMRVTYSGNGPMTRMDKRGWGAKIIDFLNPF